MDSLLFFKLLWRIKDRRERTKGFDQIKIRFQDIEGGKNARGGKLFDLHMYVMP